MERSLSTRMVVTPSAAPLPASSTMGIRWASAVTSASGMTWSRMIRPSMVPVRLCSDAMPSGRLSPAPRSRSE